MAKLFNLTDDKLKDSESVIWLDNVKIRSHVSSL